MSSQPLPPHLAGATVSLGTRILGRVLIGGVVSLIVGVAYAMMYHTALTERRVDVVPLSVASAVVGVLAIVNLVQIFTKSRTLGTAIFGYEYRSVETGERSGGMTFVKLFVSDLFIVVTLGIGGIVLLATYKDGRSLVDRWFNMVAVKTKDVDSAADQEPPAPKPAASVRQVTMPGVAAPPPGGFTGPRTGGFQAPGTAMAPKSSGFTGFTGPAVPQSSPSAMGLPTAPTPATGGVISGVPGFVPRNTPPTPPLAPPTQPPAPACSRPVGVEETLLAPPPSSPVAPAVTPPPMAPPTPASVGIPGPIASPVAPPQAGVPQFPAGSPPVPHAITDETVLDDAGGDAAPRIRFDDGAILTISAPTVFGRNPVAPDSHPDAQPYALFDETMKLSKTHAVVFAEDGQLKVVDVGARNGVVFEADAVKSKIVPGEAFEVPPGVAVHMGGRSFRVVP